jgi:general secretion pathway protein D
MKGIALVALTVFVSACGASRAFKQGEQLAREGDLDSAVAYMTRAVQEDPDKPEYRIALERTMRAASAQHFDRGRALEEKGELENAIAEYRRAIEFDPSNRPAVQRRGELERVVRERQEAARPKPRIDVMREQARRQTEAPQLSPTSKTPLSVVFNQVPLVDVFKAITGLTGINIVLEQEVQQQMANRPQTFNVEGLTLEQALNLIMTANQLWYKVMNERTILVIRDTAQKRQQYEDQIIRTFYASHAEPQELFNLLNQIIRIQGIAIPPAISVNKTANAITIRGTPNIVNILEKVIQANDRPRAEVIVDVEMLEVDRNRARQLGLNLSQYAVGAIFSPEAAPTVGEDGSIPATTIFNLNTISQGISTADFYLSVPQAVFRFLASDTYTRIIAKPQLRGAEGRELELNLGDDIPVPQTVFGGIAAGGVNTVPISSFTYRSVGVNLKMTPRVTFENEIILDVEIENSSFTGTVNIAGQDLPQFGSRKVRTRLRLREGESNLLAGLLREQDRKALTGIPGTLRTPVLRYLFGATNDEAAQTDIVFLLTPRIVRTHELTQENLNPIYIGSQLNLGLTGPAPVITAPPEPEPAQPPPGTVPPGTVPPAVGPGLLPTPVTPQPSPELTTTPGLPPVPPPPPETAPPADAGVVQVGLTTPGPEFTVGGGPYTVPLSVSGASRLSLLSLTVTYNPAAVRVQSVQEGTFLRQGGAPVTFSQNVDASAGRVDISLSRGADTIGASGTGVVAALVFEPVAPGTSTFSISGVASTPEGRTIPLRFTPASVVVK